MKKRGRSQVAGERKRKSEQQATTVLRVESSYPVRRAHQSQREAKDASARYHKNTYSIIFQNKSFLFKQKANVYF